MENIQKLNIIKQLQDKLGVKHLGDNKHIERSTVKNATQCIMESKDYIK